MNIAQLLHKLPIVPDVEIVITLLPEVLGLADQPPRHALLQRLERIGQRFFLRLAQQQMHVLGHDHIAVHAKPERVADALQGVLEDSPGRSRAE